MNFKSDQVETVTGNHLPLGIYDSVVKSLFADRISLMIGMATVIAAPIVLYVKTGDHYQLWFSALFVFFSIVRLAVTYRFLKKGRKLNRRKKLQYWESLYAITGNFHIGTLGVWFLYGFAASDDPFVHLLSLSLLLGYLIGTIGRNFGSNKVIWQQVVVSGIPIMAGLTIFGTVYDAILAAFLAPFFLSIWMISARLRKMLFGAVISAHEQKIVADRFNMALNHIAQGVAMFDREANILVSNNQFEKMVEQNGSSLVGTNLKKLENTRHIWCIESGKKTSFLDEIESSLDERTSKRFSYRSNGGETIEVDFYPMPKGGVVFLRDISEQVASEEAILNLASFDPLTKLSNRRSFMQDMASLQDCHGGLSPLSMFFVDLDKFKQVNDSLGHAVGDEMLTIVANRLKNVVPENGLICRFGGDEFVVVVPGLNEQEGCAAFADLLISEISKPLSVDTHDIRSGATVGIAVSPADGTNADQLLKASDVALYAAKAAGRGTHSFYTEHLGERIKERRQLEIDLRTAVENEDLTLYFQPLINVKQAKITTCEALLRWEHPTKGMISPVVFIPIAEEIGIISQLGAFVLKKATKACMTWPKDVRVAVNISSLQFQQSDVHAVVKEALEESGLDPSRLDAEVTESAMLDDIQQTSKTLERLKKLGVKISLDDFGTGFSSLSYLHTLPLDKVKIDRSFISGIVDNERSLTLLSGITELTNNLGLKIVVEGIETEEQSSLLCNNVRVDEMQGFLFSRPLPTKDIYALLNSKTTWDIGRDVDLEQSDAGHKSSGKDQAVA
ncbi:MAG: EAL domain-containing protein [Rhizobiaceae bacterium]|nr:EAL domain-containing protein [Rhizobiaceae bacterium]